MSVIKALRSKTKSQQIIYRIYLCKKYILVLFRLVGKATSDVIVFIKSIKRFQKTSFVYNIRKNSGKINDI